MNRNYSNLSKKTSLNNLNFLKNYKNPVVHTQGRSPGVAPGFMAEGHSGAALDETYFFKKRLYQTKDCDYSLADFTFRRKKAKPSWYSLPKKPYYAVETCPNTHEPRIVTLCSCNDWVTCKVCRRKRNKRNERVISNYLLAMQVDLPRNHSLKFLTLTMKRTGLGFKKDRLKILQSFKKLRRRKDWKSKVAFFISTFEVVEGNVHLHVAMAAKFWEQREISSGWLAVTGDSFIVDIRKITSVEKASKELAKYMAKDSSPLIVEELSEFRKDNPGLRYMLSGRRPPSLDTIAISEHPLCSTCHHKIGHQGHFAHEHEARKWIGDQIRANTRPAQHVERNQIAE